LATTGQVPDLLGGASINETGFVSLSAPGHARASSALPVIPLRLPRVGFYQRRGKRILDVVLGAMLLVVLLPLMAAVTVAVLLVSGWPILYASERVGLDGRAFSMWKFRTMVRDADDVLERWKETHPERSAALLTHWKLNDDPRVTALGRFLRKSSLDELPQFWNVLRGEMSLVGPRPYLAREVLEPGAARAIASVRPGLTGPFQICGRKHLTPLTRVRLESGYAPGVSLARDLAYIVRTAKPLITLDGY
jgi:lipopolysaccharide/colanic/teichoic acid biosynthesis glycosyltransferase